MEDDKNEKEFIEEVRRIKSEEQVWIRFSKKREGQCEIEATKPFKECGHVVNEMEEQSKEER